MQIAKHIGVRVVMMAIGIAATAAAAEPPTPATAAAKPAAPLLAPFTDHLEIAIARPAAVVWAHLKRLYVDGERSRQQGYAVTPLTDDPTAYLGGTMARLPLETRRPFVKIRVGALDEKAMLMTLVIDLENPAPVYVIHQVRPDGPNASIYQTIIQTMWPIPAKPGETVTADTVARLMRPIVDNHNTEVRNIMAREKAVIEQLPQ